TRGRRRDWDLLLDLDGAYARTITDSAGTGQTERGNWKYQPDQKVIVFSPDEPNRNESRWWVLDVTTCEDANTLLVLREVILASRNLPILLYRVHLEGERL